MSAPSNSKRAMRQLSVQEKVSAVQRVHDGESKASVARLIGVPESTLRGWCKNEMKLRTMSDQGGSGSQSPSPSPPPHPLALHQPQPPLKRARLTLDQPEPDVDDALWFWLRNQHQHEVGLRGAVAPTPLENNNHHQSSWFWKWYKEFGVQGVPPTSAPALLPSPTPAPAPAPSPDEPLPLVVPRNKELKEQAVPVLVDSNKEAKENTLSEDEDEPPASAADALKHGERFLRWLECCSDPSVTAVQLLQFRYLLNNVKSCAERRAANKTRSTRSRRK